MLDDDAALDALLETIEAHDERGEVDEVRRLVTRGRTDFPDAVELREWEVTLAIDDGDFPRALALLDGILAIVPDDFATLRERGSVLLDLGRFAEALTTFQGLSAREIDELNAHEQARLRHEIALCLDRLGRRDEADMAFRRAARLDKKSFFVPRRLPAAEFEARVAEALDTIPDELRPYLAQVVVTVQEYPGPDADDPFQLGLYVGVPRPDRGAGDQDHLDTVVVFQRPHELQCADDEALRTEVRNTVIHELAHHFGFEHGELGEYE